MLTVDMPVRCQIYPLSRLLGKGFNPKSCGQMIVA